MQEKQEIERLSELLSERLSSKPKVPSDRMHSPSEAEITAMIQLVNENQLLEVSFLSFNIACRTICSINF